jgi:uncharacterized protein YbbK (DUF523 family)
MNHETVLVSACLLGMRCRYDGGHAYCPEVFDGLWRSHFAPVCPEQLGGLPTPRPPAQIERGDGRDVLQGLARVINQRGEDVTSSFLKGAQETLSIARLLKARKAILKDHSPSCGCRTIHREGELFRGVGVTAALLWENGLEVVSEVGETMVSPGRKNVDS